MNVKQRAAEIYQEHIALASTDGRLFRKTVLSQLMAETGCSIAAAATHYNFAKKASPVEGLGRVPTPAGVRKVSGGRARRQPELTPDDQCFAVMELVGESGSEEVGRYQSFLLQGDASEKFDEKVAAWPGATWVMIQGLGPNNGESFRLGGQERVIKRYDPVAPQIEAVIPD